MTVTLLLGEAVIWAQNAQKSLLANEREQDPERLVRNAREARASLARAKRLLGQATAQIGHE